MKNKPRSRRDVGSQRRDIGSSTFWNVATLDLNVGTSISPLSGTSRLGSRCRDVGVKASLSRRDVDIQCRDVGNSTLWNVATLSLNVVTLSSKVTTLSPNVETLPIFYDKRHSFFGPPHAQPRRNPPAPSLLPNSYHSVAFATTGLIAPPPVLRTCLESPSPPP